MEKFKKANVLMLYLLCFPIIILGNRYSPEKDFLSSDWADYINQNPGGGDRDNDKKSIEKARQFRKEGYVLYKAKKDKEAIKLYEAALELYADSDIYYDYANSLSNLEGRLEDSIKAYLIGIEFSTRYGQPAQVNLYYNLGCAYSRINKIKDALEYLRSAYLFGKELSIMKTDSDLENIRNQVSKWEKIVTSKSPGGKLWRPPHANAGGFGTSIYYCGLPEDDIGKVVKIDIYNGGKSTQIGIWQIKGDNIISTFNREKGTRGIGKTDEGPRGPEYTKSEEFDINIEKQTAENVNDFFKRSWLYNFEGPCPEP